MNALPIDPLLPELVRTLEQQQCLVLEAPPGAGKTTRVPRALWQAGLDEVIVLEPRRLAARLAARRVAQELNEPLGKTVGYQVRLETVAGPETRIRFLTEGVLTRVLLQNPRLERTKTVILDEFHERHLDGDVALALLRRLQKTTRPDLRLVVMSATLDGSAISDFLDHCPILKSEGRLFPVNLEFTPSQSAPLEEQVAQAAERLIREKTAGDILVFLPGAAEIRRAQRSCASLAERLNRMLVPLHGDLSPEEQDRAVLPGAQPKIILSTNVAESSITIEGVRAVIDSGLARVARESASGLPRVEVTRVSRSSAVQRAGRAGRTGPGRVIRLFSEDDFLRRPQSDVPEIHRRELSQLTLELHAAGITDPASLEWLDAPEPGAWQRAEALLQGLSAINEHGALTATGRIMARIPLHPRLSRIVAAAEERGVGEEGCRAAALLSSNARLPQEAPHRGKSDVLLLMELNRDPMVRQLEQQMRRIARVATHGKGDTALLQALLAAYPDRVARRRKDNELKLVGGGSAQLARNSCVGSETFLLAIDVEERPEAGLPLVRIASAIEPDWLLDQFSDRIREERRLEWNRTAERVEEIDSILYDDLPIDETRRHPSDPEEAGRFLAARAMEAGIERFCDAEELGRFRQRLHFATSQNALAPVDSAVWEAALAGLAYGLKSFAELRSAAGDGGLERAVLQQIGAADARVLDDIAPEKIRLPSGRNTRVFYAEGQPPWVASRLQDFFGMRETPRVARGSVPVVVHLLAPNQRPVQMTQDLAGFWQRLYPQVRKELMRRYPKHAWPENPYTAIKP